jgi:hypothetical protein
LGHSVLFVLIQGSWSFGSSSFSEGLLKAHRATSQSFGAFWTLERESKNVTSNQRSLHVWKLRIFWEFIHWARWSSLALCYCYFCVTICPGFSHFYKLQIVTSLLL